ncbi:hypothetical protein Clacol_005204 [Clathrus columnatus]|uniref:DUF6533 domain-containing protein n=1 Tax=Clathrus columnatus TaxID=1419009 RepID=A0AAV5AGA9_9AGAM|nr:hypothetical protein Clacol_005204 [Clathrus columnatus]
MFQDGLCPFRIASRRPPESPSREHKWKAHLSSFSQSKRRKAIILNAQFSEAKTFITNDNASRMADLFCCIHSSGIYLGLLQEDKINPRADRAVPFAVISRESSPLVVNDGSTCITSGLHSPEGIDTILYRSRRFLHRHVILISFITGSVVLAYDYLLTFSAEVKYIWRRKPTLPSILFLILRYFTFVGAFVATSLVVPGTYEVISYVLNSSNYLI